MKAVVQVLIPTTTEQLDQVRALMRAFIGWHRERHQQDLALIDSYFDAAAVEAELAGLPGKYAPPGGGLAGCEMKRMFVYPMFHGQGIGRALAEAVIRDARAIGYGTMLLDTSIRQAEAQALYRRMGFRDIAAYYDLPDDLRNWLVFMELPLDA